MLFEMELKDVVGDDSMTRMKESFVLPHLCLKVEDHKAEGSHH